MIFTRPLFLYSIPVVILIGSALIVFNMMRKRKLVDKILATGHKSNLSLTDMKAEILKEFFIVLALVSFLFAAAGPADESEISSMTKKGIDVIFVCDISRSMDASLPVRKLETAKKIMTGVIERRPDDRISLIIFSGSSTIVSPLTFDHRSLLSAIEKLSAQTTTSTGTALSGAFGSLERVIEKEATRSTAVILLSDGEDFGPDISGGIQNLSENRIPVISVGIGSVDSDPVPEINYKGEITGYIMLSAYDTAKTYLDEEMLKRISNSTKGLYLKAENSSRTAEEISNFLEGLKKETISQKQDVLFVYHYEIPLAIGAVLIALSITVEKKRRIKKCYL
ncbi:VWA domain-containing protein [candidate division WOR-3 bacterium]|nr:VWA domain-containing protein [candidate division WOR-3 bacterium]